MKWALRTVVVAALGLLAARDSGPGSDPARDPSPAPAARSGPLGARFEANVGQADPSVRFVARYGRATVLVTSDALILLPPARPGKASHAARRALVEGRRPPFAPRGTPSVIRFRGADARAPMNGEAPISASITSFRGPNAKPLAIPSFERVRARNVYPGIDVVLHPGPRGIEIDFELAPGADPSRIALAGDRDDESFLVRSDGSLASRRHDRDVVLSPPRTFEVRGSQRADVPSRWRDGATFALGAHRTDVPLVIDPVLDMATYLGGSGDEGTGIEGVALDGAGNIYAAGSTTSTDLPLTAGAPQAALLGTDDVFVAKVSGDGKTLLYCTYLGGGDIETYSYVNRPIAVDAAGAVYVSGQTASTDFPTTAAAPYPNNAGGLDAYATKIAPDGKSLVYSTYLGGSGDDHGFGVAVDATTGALLVGGWTKSLDFPTTAGTLASSAPSFIVKLAPTGSVAFSTRAGGPSTVLYGLAARNGVPTVIGDTRDTAFPVTPGAAQATYGGGSFDAIVMQLDDKGTRYELATYLGGNGLDETFAVDVDAAGNVLVLGNTESTNFPVTTNALDPTHRGDQDGFVTKLDPKGTKLLYSSYIGGPTYDGTTGGCFDPDGNAFVSGYTFGGLTTKAECTTSGLGFIQMLGPTGAVRWSTYMPDQVFGLACAQRRVVGFMAVAGEDLATAGTFDTTFNGGTDALLFGLRHGSGPADVGCKPCDGAFDAGTSRACDDPARPLCNTSGALSGACTICNGADATRCVKGKVCDLLTGDCVEPMPDAGPDAGLDSGVLDAAVSVEGGIDAGGRGNDASDASADEDASSCSCRTPGARGAPSPSFVLLLAVLVTARAGRRWRNVTAAVR